MTHPLIDRLSTQTLVADGAMGTLIHEAGVPMGTCFDLLNLTNPDLISSIHRAYLGAGADIIETNTYGANRLKLAEFGQEEKVREINRRAVKIAREAREVVGREVFVIGSVGPTHLATDPLTDQELVEIAPVYAEQIGALLEGGVDAICIETISDIREMTVAVKAVRANSDLPVIAMLAFLEDGTTPGGNGVRDVVAALLELGVDVIGANCSIGPNYMLPIVETMSSLVTAANHRNIPIATMPNAGWPERVDGRFIFSSSPEYLGRFAGEAAHFGARLIGGCCGTTPEHTKFMRKAVDELTDQPSRTVVNVKLPSAYDFEIESDDHQPTELATKLGKEFVICVEIDPPKGVNPKKALDGARLLKEAGVTAINVADSPMARVRMSALMMSHLIQDEVGVETIVHFTTRDRSLMAIQSELLGAHAAGVRNILALTGDPPSLGDYPDSSAVYDIDSIGLIKVLTKMNDGTDWSGAPLGHKASFTIACAVDPTRDDLELEAGRLRAKIEAGAHFVMTQPIYDLEVWLRFMEIYGEIPVPVMIGILPLQSARHADFLHNEVPGITLTERALKRMHDAGANGRAEGVEMARELLLDLMPYSQGVYLMPSFGRYEVAAEVLAGVVTTV